MNFLNNNTVWQQLPQMMSNALQLNNPNQSVGFSRQTQSYSMDDLQNAFSGFNPTQWAQSTTEQYSTKADCLFNYATYKGKDVSSQGVSYENLMKAKSTYKSDISDEAHEFAELMCGNKELFNQVAGDDGRISREEMKMFNNQYFSSLGQGLTAQTAPVSYQYPVSQPMYVDTTPYYSYQQPNVYINGMSVNPYQNNWVWQTPVTPFSTQMPASYYDNSWVWQQPQMMMPMYYGMAPQSAAVDPYAYVDYSAQVPMDWGAYPEFNQDPLMGLVNWADYMPQGPVQSWS